MVPEPWRLCVATTILLAATCVITGSQNFVYVAQFSLATTACVGAAGKHDRGWRTLAAGLLIYGAAGPLQSILQSLTGHPTGLLVATCLYAPAYALLAAGLLLATPRRTSRQIADAIVISSLLWATIAISSNSHLDWPTRIWTIAFYPAMDVMMVAVAVSMLVERIEPDRILLVLGIGCLLTADTLLDFTNAVQLSHPYLILSNLNAVWTMAFGLVAAATLCPSTMTPRVLAVPGAWMGLGIIAAVAMVLSVGLNTWLPFAPLLGAVDVVLVSAGRPVLSREHANATTHHRTPPL